MRNVSFGVNPSRQSAWKWVVVLAVLLAGREINRAQTTGAGTPESNVVSPDEPRLLVGRFSIQYQKPSSDLPAVGDLYQATANLHRFRDGYTAQAAGGPGLPYELRDKDLKNRKFSLNGIKAVEDGLRKYLNSQGVIAVFVYAADPNAAPPAPGEAPAPMNYAATADNDKPVDVPLIIVVGVVQHVQAITSGRTDGIFPIFTKFYGSEQSIVANSPVHAGGVLNKPALDDYLYLLNRQPARHVEAAITSADTNNDEDVDLDYLVHQGKPWTVYFQASNTGTKDTSPWVEQFGVIDNQLTDHDDIFSLAYSTASFKDTYDVSASYDKPVLGIQRIRYRIYGDVNRFTASDVGIAQDRLTGDGYEAGMEGVFNVFQYQDLFIDAVGGAKVDNYFVRESSPSTSSADAAFLFPYVGARLSRETDEAVSHADVNFEANPITPDSPNEENIIGLGRLDAQRRYMILQADVSQSLYLEPLLTDWPNRDTNLHPVAANELFGSAHGQWSMSDKRLVPELEEPVGGLNSVRGYPESIIAGDTAIVGTIEYRLHIPRLLGIGSPNSLEGRQVPSSGLLNNEGFYFQPRATDTPGDWDLVASAFVDGGRVHFNDESDTGPHDATLVSAGLGLDLLIKDNIVIQTDYGVALDPIHEPAALDQDVTRYSGRFNFLFTILY